MAGISLSVVDAFALQHSDNMYEFCISVQQESVLLLFVQLTDHNSKHLH